MDKMFFLINAADLAADEAELALVAGHVRKNLQLCGIRDARIYPVSSQTALWSRLLAAGALPADAAARLHRRLEGEPTDLAARGILASGMMPFEQDFYGYVGRELSQLAINAAFAEAGRAAQTVAHWAEAALEDQGARTRRLEALQVAGAAVTAQVSAAESSREAADLEREVDELLFYVRRRVLERFREGFAEAFNPAVLRQDAPDLKRLLREALREVTQFVAYDLGQEMRATALRTENLLHRLIRRIGERTRAAAQRLLPDWRPSEPGGQELPVPAFSDGSEHLRPEPMQKLLGHFKNPEQFFAGGGRNLLREDLGKALEAPVSAYLAEARPLLLSHYGAALAGRTEELKAHLATDLHDHVQGMVEALSGTNDAGRLEAVQAALRNCLPQ